MADRRQILIQLLGEETVSRMADRAGGGLDRFGDKLDATERDAKHLDKQIAEVEQNLQTLAVAFSRTGDEADKLDISKAMRKQQAELRRLTKAKDLLPDPDGEDTRSWAKKFGSRVGTLAGDALKDAGGPISNALGAVFGEFPPQAQAGIGAGVVAAVGSVAPLIGGVVAGAVVGGVGIGGVLGGIMVAAKHPAVQAAGAEVGETLRETAQHAFAPFVPETVHALSEIGDGIDDLGPSLDRIGAKASKFVEPLTQGALGFADNLLPGVEAAVDRAGPVINELASWGPKLGTLLSGIFTEFSDHAVEGAQALAMFWAIMSDGIKYVADLATGLATVYGWIDKGSALLTGNIGHLVELEAAHRSAAAGGDDLSQSLKDIIDGFGKTDATAASATAQVESFSDAVARMAGENISAEQANIRLEEAIDQASESIKNNGHHLDTTTAKGRANREALIGIAQAANDSAAAILKQTNSQELASEATQRGRAAFLRAADAMGMEKGEARRLADQLFAIPNVTRTVTVKSNTKPAINAAQAAVARINRMTAEIRVKANPSGSFGGSAHSGYGNAPGMSTGGPVIGPGPKGVDSEQRLLAPGEWVLTAGEVDQLGGAAGVRQLLSGAGGGGQAVRMASAPQPAAPASVVVRVEVGSGGTATDRAVAAMIMGLLRTGVLQLKAGTTTVRPA